ncbi:hypothetical protein PtrM4_119320 [Pyrenophora tritici-repentis]|uniref:Uncharacterized protein n=1 Tax=Pyrenophora tritici-repentis TaxID=45151 RepID=A0A834RTT3_9PLEO|nr:hypothetical protein PtrM4_119320 [Pyrenophora tritici-repentis]
MNHVSLRFLTPRHATLASCSNGARLGPSLSPQHITQPRARTRYSASHAPWRTGSDSNQRTNSGYYYDKAFTPELYYPLGPIPSNVHDLVPLVRRIKNFKKTEHRYPPVFNEDRTVVTGLMDRIGEGGWTIDKAIDFYALKQHPFIGEENISNC